MKTLPLTSAVTSILIALTDSRASFSAHDVTRELRRQANTGELEITDLTRENVDGIAGTYRIDHNKVREYVSASFTSLSDYERDFSRGYTLYRPKANAYIVPNAPAIAAPTTVFASNSDLDSKIRTYVSRKHAVGSAPTLKQIQSRLKGTSVTCAQLSNIAQGLGFRISFNKARPSRSVVTI